jgi:hypothetical protein
MKAPTNTDKLFPDCFGHLDRLDDDRIDQAVCWLVRGITTLVAIGMAAAG